MTFRHVTCILTLHSFIHSYHVLKVDILQLTHTNQLNSTSMYGRRCKHLNVRIYLTQTHMKLHINYTPGLFTVISEHICFLLLVFFLFLHFLVVGLTRQIKLTHVGFRAHVKIASRIVSYESGWRIKYRVTPKGCTFFNTPYLLTLLSQSHLILFQYQ